MKFIFPNVLHLTFRLGLLSLFVYMYQWPLAKINTGEYKQNLPVFFISVICFSIFPAFILWSLSSVIFIKIKKDNSKIYFYYFYKVIVSSPYDLTSYKKSIKMSKIKDYKAVILKLKSGQKVILSEDNIFSLDSIYAFLSLNKIPQV